jgi:hypothetical protein
VLRRFETESLRLRKRDLVVHRFADEQMDVLRHDDVVEDFEIVALPGEFEGVEEDVFRSTSSEVGFAAVTTEGDEVVVAFSLESREA